MTTNSTDPVNAEGTTSARPDVLPVPSNSGAIANPGATRRSTVFPALLAILIILVAVQLVPWFMERVAYSITRGRTQAEREAASERAGSKFTEISRRVATLVDPSVVHINTRSSVPVRGPLGNIRTETDGQGSGVIVGKAGYILTNLHVIASANQINVRLAHDLTYRADVVGADEFTDLAVLKINHDGLIPLEWGDSNALQSGDPVWAVGSPFGLANSVSFGIIAAKSRQGIGRSRFQDYLQSDAAVNPGNSGGALVNERGKLIGINTAIIGESYQGISFAIPSNMARNVYEEIRTSGQVARGWLGVQLDKVTSEIAEQLKLSDSKGAFVVAVVRDSPAERGDVQRGDVVVKWNDQEVTDPRQFAKLVAGTEPDTEVQAVVIRLGQPVPLSIRVGRLPTMLDR
ncbi:MAG: trypsin-like peptidase domain-containing protein [Planctomycetota bacterium]|nr:trypsin-like peptidase domain-containing protein [Planctomycetota bacterium]